MTPETAARLLIGLGAAFSFGAGFVLALEFIPCG